MRALLGLLLCALLSFPLYAQVTVVDSNALSENDGDPTTLTLTVPSANHVLYACVVSDTATAHTPTITFNGDALTQVSVTTGTGQALWMGRLINPDVVVGGSLTTTAGTTTRQLGYVLVSGADTTTPNLTPVLEENGATTTLTGGGGVASDANGIVLSCATANNNAAINATGTNQSELEEVAQGSASVLGISQTPGTGSTITTAWSWIGSNRGSQIVVSVQPAAGADDTPNAFSFTDQTNVALSDTITSAAVTIDGIDVEIECTATGGTIDLNGDDNFQAAQDVNDGDEIRARHTSSASNSTAVNTLVDCNGVSDTFTSTTEAASGGAALLGIYLQH